MRNGAPNGPVLSVVVLLFASRDALIRCLDGLGAQSRAPDEILVPHDDALVDPDVLAARFPGVRWLRFEGTYTPAQLRARGVTASRGTIVALLEDHCVPDTNWCERILQWHRHPHAAVGGAVEKGFAPGRTTDTALNWAVYLTDYSRYMNPLPAGPAHGVTDTNASYKRRDLDEIADAWSNEFHENVVNDRLRECGRSLWFAPDVVVREHRDLDLPRALRDRYAFGRLFAATRVAGAPFPRRLAWAAASVALPPVLIARVARNLFTRRRHRSVFIRCLPPLVLITGTWMCGEAIGYITGRAGPGLDGARAG